VEQAIVASVARAARQEQGEDSERHEHRQDRPELDRRQRPAPGEKPPPRDHEPESHDDEGQSPGHVPGTHILCRPDAEIPGFRQRDDGQQDQKSAERGARNITTRF
jgi:hypothetical protein